MADRPVTGTAGMRGRYEDVLARIEAAAEKAGKKGSQITLVAVTKKVDIPRIRDAAALGIRHFGENYVQEAQDKISSLGIDVTWHFIGHLQKNKVNTAVEYFQMIQSVDSISLAEKLNRKSEGIGRALDILLQVHYGEETTKHGFEPGELKKSMEKLEKFTWLNFRGLMTIPPLVSDPGHNRGSFRDLRVLSESLDRAGYQNWENRYLSMGMTDDFEIAIEEGSTMVRIGRAIFGERT